MRKGVRIGLDIGDARIGVAVSDPDGILATPVETVAAGDLDRIASLVADLDAMEIVVGLPRSLSGREGPAAIRMREVAAQLDSRVPVTLRLVDERFTTVTAERVLRDRGRLRYRGRKGRKRRAVVDQAAAVVILQHALDLERETGAPPGEPLADGTE